VSEVHVSEGRCKFIFEFARLNDVFKLTYVKLIYKEC
jgi:hypothetical protein